MSLPLIPCPTCPWRKSSTVGGFDIPGFSLCKMQGLSNTVGRGDDFRPIMACHYSEEGGEQPCRGYIAQVGWTNLSLRVMAIDGRVDIAGTMDASAEIEMWASFEEMLAAYEEANA